MPARRRFEAGFEIIIRDEGPGFDLSNLPHAADPEDPERHMVHRDALGLRPGGFGILMTRGLVDEMSYNPRGNEVRLVKFVQPSPPAKVEGTGGQAANGTEV